MNDITTKKPTIDSREVAEMIGQRHADLLRTINGYVEILEKSTERNFALSDFFLRDTYQDGTCRTLPCYQITRKGCDMVANKMTGEKGVLFTAAYVTKFEQMEQVLTRPQSAAEMFMAQAQAFLDQERKMNELSARTDHVEDVAKAAHHRLDNLDRIDLDGTPQQQLGKLVNRYAQKKGIIFAEGWREFRAAFNTAFHTNIKFRMDNWAKANNKRRPSIPEYLSSVGQIEDGLRIIQKMLAGVTPEHEVYYPNGR